MGRLLTEKTHINNPQVRCMRFGRMYLPDVGAICIVGLSGEVATDREVKLDFNMSQQLEIGI